MGIDSTTASSASHRPVQLLGSHRVVVEGYIILIWFVGPFNMDQFRQFIALTEKVFAAHGFAYVIADLKEAGGVDAAVRKAAVPWLSRVQLRGFANIQANVITRALSILLVNAVRLMTGIALPQGFFESEAKARAWIAAQQERHSEHESRPPPG